MLQRNREITPALYASEQSPHFPAMTAPFWKSKHLSEMTDSEWESLCDGCGNCCLLKLEDEDTGDIALTRVACRLLDIGSCRCSDYCNRADQVPDCVKLTPHTIAGIAWLPNTCAYRLVAEGRDLHWWHPLISGSPETVHEAGISVRTSAINENGIPVESLPGFITGWIRRRKPKRRRKSRPA
jgi:hypothetical protein